jgi:hypothetical protein
MQAMKTNIFNIQTHISIVHGDYLCSEAEIIYPEYIVFRKHTGSIGGLHSAAQVLTPLTYEDTEAL